LNEEEGEEEFRRKKKRRKKKWRKEPDHPFRLGEIRVKAQGLAILV